MTARQVAKGTHGRLRSWRLNCLGSVCRKDLNNLTTAVGRICVLQGRWFVART